MRTVMAGPILGELGWLIFDIAPHVAGFFAQHIDDRKVVVCRSRDRFFFPDADDFVTLPPDCLPKMEIGRGWWTGKSRAPIIKACAWADTQVQPDEMLDIPFFKVRAAEWGVDPLYKRLVSYPIEIEEMYDAKPYVVVAARWMKRGPKKNWETAHWDTLVKSILNEYKGMQVFAIGKEGESYVPEGAAEMFHTIEDSVHLLNNAAWCVTSNSGTTHLAIMSGCPTLSWGSRWLERRVTETTNPLGTDVLYVPIGWDPKPAYIFKEIKKWRSK